MAREMDYNGRKRLIEIGLMGLFQGSEIPFSFVYIMHMINTGVVVLVFY